MPCRSDHCCAARSAPVHQYGSEGARLPEASLGTFRSASMSAYLSPQACAVCVARTPDIHVLVPQGAAPQWVQVLVGVWEFDVRPCGGLCHDASGSVAW